MQYTYRKAIRLEIESYGVVNFSVGQSSAWMTSLNTTFTPPDDQHVLNTISKFLDSIQILPLENLAIHQDICNNVEKEFEEFRKGIRAMVNMDGIRWDKVISNDKVMTWTSETRTEEDCLPPQHRLQIPGQYPDDAVLSNDARQMRVTIVYEPRYTIAYRAIPEQGNSI